MGDRTAVMYLGSIWVCCEFAAAGDGVCREPGHQQILLGARYTAALTAPQRRGFIGILCGVDVMLFTDPWRAEEIIAVEW